TIPRTPHRPRRRAAGGRDKPKASDGVAENVGDGKSEKIGPHAAESLTSSLTSGGPGGIFRALRGNSLVKETRASARSQYTRSPAQIHGPVRAPPPSRGTPAAATSSGSGRSARPRRSSRRRPRAAAPTSS